ncbi:hypothetical protein M378DRAFT_15852 [Amanita muscaria Koide BX008]|uniref:Uncharacterized protein n=1 Tax=Amanita muscaria (strain Koide BX008) TaxID=946122 RepID=A0A0C2WMQ0_AMAMK|nr:hypothetical protein M378DRAFT_15852 [Amanita muscaria Koide BX008]
MINALTAKMEMGSPMASLYWLGNPDHYTGHQFVNRMKDPQKLFSVETMEN